MVLGKLVIPVAIVAIGIAIGAHIGSINVPENVERPWLYRSIFVSFDLIGKISKCLSFFNIESEYDSHRLMTSYLASFTQPELVSGVQNDSYRLVGVRVYSPKGLSEDKLQPAMIYVHGNFRAFGSLKFYDNYLMRLARKTNMKIISINYKLPPEASFTEQLKDCYTIMQYILKKGTKLNIDLNRLVIGGDSEGGHLVIALNQKLYKNEKFVPKLQVLIYPTVQMFNNLLPSAQKYKTGVVGSADISSGKLALWNLGIKHVSGPMADALTSNSHIHLINDNERVTKFLNFLNVTPSPIFKENQRLTERVRKVFDGEMSPALVDSQDLMNAPATYIIICGLDGLRDEQFIYAERLKSVQRKVEIAYYENGFHGMAPLLDTKRWGFKLSVKMHNDLVRFIVNNV